jgi:hypothetical protein
MTFVHLVSFMLGALPIQAILQALCSILLSFAEFVSSLTESLLLLLMAAMFGTFVSVAIHKWPRSMVIVGILTAGKWCNAFANIQGCRTPVALTNAKADGTTGTSKIAPNPIIRYFTFPEISRVRIGPFSFGDASEVTR